MNKALLIAIFSILIAIGGIFLYSRLGPASGRGSLSTNQQNRSFNSENGEDTPAVSIIAENFDTPWGIAFLPSPAAGGPDKSMLVTERQGTVKLVDASDNNKVSEIAKIESAREIGEGGLLGIAIHPDFESNNYVYLYYTYDAEGSNTRNRVTRMTYADNSLTDEKIIVDNIPGASNHNGGRIKFGPDKFLYIATGDSQEPSLAQDRNSLAGKILRVTDEGRPAPGNPFNNAVYSYGHRNVQGITWDKDGDMWQTEHGRSAPTGLDEVNFIEAGKNYGWPDIQGDEKQAEMIAPVRNSGAFSTWAPASAAFIGDSLFFSGLRGETLYEAVTQNGQVTDFKEHFKNEFGRLREVIAGPDGMLYITTSNQDGRGTPGDGDDKILRINPQKLE